MCRSCVSKNNSGTERRARPTTGNCSKRSAAQGWAFLGHAGTSMRARIDVPTHFFLLLFSLFLLSLFFFSLRHLMSGTCISADTTAMMAECSVTASSQGMRGLTKGRSALHAFHLIYQDCRTRFSFFEASGRASDQNSWPTSNV